MQTEPINTKPAIKSKTIWAQIIAMAIGLLIALADYFNLPTANTSANEIAGVATLILNALGIGGRKAATKTIKGLLTIALLSVIPTVVGAQSVKLKVDKNIKKEGRRTTVFCLHNLADVELIEANGFNCQSVASLEADKLALQREYMLPNNITNKQTLQFIPKYHSNIYRTFYAECKNKRQKRKCNKFLEKNGLAQSIEPAVLNYPSSYSGVKFVNKRKAKAASNVINTNDPDNQHLYTLEHNKVFDTWATHPITKGAGQRVLVVDTPPRFTHLDIRNNLLKINGAVQAYEPYGDSIGVHDFENFHGTHTGGTIIAEENNGIGISGITPNSKVIYSSGLQAGGFGWSHKIIEAIKWASDLGYDIGNHSYGPGLTQSLADVFELSNSRGQINIVAAGNDGMGIENPLHIAALPSVIGVAALKEDGTRATFSNSGETLDASHYGSRIRSLTVTNDAATTDAWGTSMAAPHIAGIINACDAKAKLLRAGNGLTLTEVKEIILRAGVPVVGSNPKTIPPLLTMQNAVNATINLINGVPNIPPEPTPTPNIPVTVIVTLNQCSYNKTTGGAVVFQYKIENAAYQNKETFNSVAEWHAMVQASKSAKMILFNREKQTYYFIK